MRASVLACVAVAAAWAFTGVALGAGPPQTTASPAGAGLPAASPVSPQIFAPRSLSVPPPTFTANARQAIRAASATGAARRARARHPDIVARAYISPLALRSGSFYHWEVYFSAGKRALVEVDLDRAAHVLEVQTAPDVGWTLLRGYPGVLGGRLNAPYIWLPLCLLFLLPFVDPRRPRRLLHLDLAVLLGFGLSQFFFTRGEPDLSVPLVYPFLAYVVGRALYAAYAPRRRPGPLVPFLSTRALAVGIVVLLILRAGFGLADSQVFDIGTAGVVGADRIERGEPLYVRNDLHGDTYGPVNYLMYIPFEVAFPYTPDGDAGRAARPATLVFDLLTVLGLFLLGRRLRGGSAGTRLGVTLAYAWTAFPYTALVIAANTNDALVPLFIVYALVCLRSPPARGVLAALGAMAKFAPLALLPVLLAGRSISRRRDVIVASAFAAIACAAVIWPFVPAGGLRELWDTTLGFQLGRESPLSIWVRDPGLGWLRPAAQVFAIGLAALAAFSPPRRTCAQIAALCAAILAATQVPSNYWLYFYVVWFAPFLLVALFEEYRELGPRLPGDQASVTIDFGKPVRMSQPESVTTTRSSIRTPS